jgi:hypothetical protein
VSMSLGRAFPLGAAAGGVSALSRGDSLCDTALSTVTGAFFGAGGNLVGFYTSLGLARKGASITKAIPIGGNAGGAASVFLGLSGLLPSPVCNSPPPEDCGCRK